MSRLIAILLALIVALPSLAFFPDTAAAAPPRQAVATAEEDPAVVAERAARFPFNLHAHVDRYWAAEFAAEGLAYEAPQGVVGIEAPTMTACGPADPMTEAAFYCLLDETIYYSVIFRQWVETNIGDFGWIVVVAHEWGHHAQQETGIELIAAPDQAGAVSTFELEQQADCLAGAYSAWAEADGWLDPGDIEEALTVTALSGDPIGTPWNAPGAHGTGEERVASFLDGYGEGRAACGFEL